MTISDLEQPDLIASARCTESDLVVELIDGRTVSAPLWWYPRLLQATPVLSLRSVGIFGLLGRARGIDFVAFFPPKMGFRRPNL